MLRILTLLSVMVSLGAKYESPNFVVHAPNEAIASQIALAAESARREISVDWLGKELPAWKSACEVFVRVGETRPNGATLYRLGYGPASGLRIELSGPLGRILDSVLPHEMTHAVLATHFKNPLPRWADEGAATLSESEPQRQRQKVLARELVQSRHHIPLKQLLNMREYPNLPLDSMSLYCIGYSLSDFLVQSGGKARYIEFLETADEREWDHCLKTFYGFQDIDQFEVKWIEWLEEQPSVSAERWL